jgi:microcystin-dependent protein
MEPFIGQIELFAFNFAPKSWMVCTGQMMQISQNTALFSLLGTNFGGDGRTTFALPNLKGKEPMPGLQYCIAIQGIYPPRD